MKTHIITTYTGDKYEITADQERQLETLGKNDKISINGSIIYGGNISGVPKIEDYYRNHPQERPMPEYKALEAPKEEPLTRERYVNCARQTLKGIRQYIDESPNPTPTALLIAKNLAQKIKDAKEGGGKFAKSQKELVNQLS